MRTERRMIAETVAVDVRVELGGVVASVPGRTLPAVK
jgi:hypothetical protein